MLEFIFKINDKIQFPLSFSIPLLHFLELSLVVFPFFVFLPGEEHVAGREYHSTPVDRAYSAYLLAVFFWWRIREGGEEIFLEFQVRVPEFEASAYV